MHACNAYLSLIAAAMHAHVTESFLNDHTCCTIYEATTCSTRVDAHLLLSNQS
jgi:hypothetical protein